MYEPFRRVLLGLPAALLLLSGARAQASTVYATGFENPPFTLGSLLGQNGWAVAYATPTATVENTVVSSGSQAVQYLANSNTSYTQEDIYHTDAFDATNRTVTLTTDFRLQSSTSETPWEFGGSQTDGSFDGGLLIEPNGVLYVLTKTGYVIGTGTVSRNTWYTATLVFDFSTEEYNVLLDGHPVANNLSMSNGNREFLSGLFTSFGTGNDSEYLDNYSVSQTPEPATLGYMGLVAFGSAAFVGLKGRLKPGSRQRTL